MLNRPAAMGAALAFSLALFCVINALAAPGSKVPQANRRAVSSKDCATVTDAEIVKAIQEKIKADKQFKDRLRYINVSSKEKVVTLNGWVRAKSAATLVKYARSTRCVKRVVKNTHEVLMVGCPRRTQPCGDTCIDEGATCNVIQ